MWNFSLRIKKKNETYRIQIRRKVSEPARQTEKRTLDAARRTNRWQNVQDRERKPSNEENHENDSENFNCASFAAAIIFHSQHVEGSLNKTILHERSSRVAEIEKLNGFSFASTLKIVKKTSFVKLRNRTERFELRTIDRSKTKSLKNSTEILFVKATIQSIKPRAQFPLFVRIYDVDLISSNSEMFRRKRMFTRLFGRKRVIHGFRYERVNTL